MALVLGEIGVVNKLIVGEDKPLTTGSTGLWVSKLMLLVGKLVLLLVHWETVLKLISWPKLRGCIKEEELEGESERESEEESLTCTSTAFRSILRDSKISGLCLIALSRKAEDVLWIDLKKSSTFLLISSSCDKKQILSLFEI